MIESTWHYSAGPGPQQIIKSQLKKSKLGKKIIKSNLFSFSFSLPFCQDRCTMYVQNGTGQAIPSSAWCPGEPLACSSSHTWGKPSEYHSGHNSPVFKESPRIIFKPNEAQTAKYAIHMGQVFSGMNEKWQKTDRLSYQFWGGKA